MRARQESGNRPALGRARRKGDPKRAVRKRRKVRGQEGPREGGTARKSRTPVDRCQVVQGPWHHASPAGGCPITLERSQGRVRLPRPREGPIPRCPRNAGTHHLPRRGCPRHAHDGRTVPRRDRDGGDPRGSRGSARSAAGARGTMPAARRPPAVTPPCARQNPRRDVEGERSAIQVSRATRPGGRDSRTCDKHPKEKWGGVRVAGALRLNFAGPRATRSRRAVAKPNMFPDVGPPLGATDGALSDRVGARSGVPSLRRPRAFRESGSSILRGLRLLHSGKREVPVLALGRPYP